jgi:hypothetical protein
MLDLVTVYEAGKILDRTTSSVRWLEHTGKLKASARVGRRGGIRLFDRAAVERFKAERDAKRAARWADE